MNIVVKNTNSWGADIVEYVNEHGEMKEREPGGGCGWMFGWPLWFLLCAVLFYGAASAGKGDTGRHLVPNVDEGICVMVDNHCR